MSRKGKALAAVITLLFIGLVVWTVRSIPTGHLPMQTTDDSRVMSYDGNTISEEKDGRKIWELTAQHIEMNLDTKDATMTGITRHFYAEDGRVVDVKAEKASYDAATKDVKIEDGIEITTSDGASMKSDELLWTAAEDMLTAQGNVYMAKDDMQASGDSITSKDGFNQLTLTGNAYITKADMEASGSSITSEDGLKQFTIEGPVHVSKGDMSATGDRLETTPNVTKIKLIGHVHIKQ